MAERMLESHVVHRPSLMPSRIVLRDQGASAVQPYVTHIETLQWQESGWTHVSYVHGHYFSDSTRAVADFHERVEGL